MRFAGQEKYFVSEASVYRLLKAHGLITFADRIERHASEGEAAVSKLSPLLDAGDELATAGSLCRALQMALSEIEDDAEALGALAYAIQMKFEAAEKMKLCEREAA